MPNNGYKKNKQSNLIFYCRSVSYINDHSVPESQKESDFFVCICISPPASQSFMVGYKVDGIVMYNLYIYVRIQIKNMLNYQ